MKKIITYTFFIFIAAWLVGFIVFNQQINSYELDDNTKTSAIIALTGGRNRISQAVELLNNGMAEKLFISGVQKNTSLSEIKKRKDVNVQTKREIELGYEATNTIENAIESKQWLLSENINSIRLVTSNYHIPRTSQEFKFQNPNLKIIYHPVYSDKVHKKWWKSWKTFSLLFVEYNKFLYVYVVNNFLLRGI